ncbi:MAG: YhcH/YjgK/YiaL family protein [Proteobacteria bacterium]|nr:YhcH/YjgK/YiaL family protein [Pseudomonadota bacterium]MBU1639022.1 YhcH/YjgK/YiaL family protein [Pseudomonadota bacterium]
MIFDVLANAERYIGLHPGFATAFAFLRRPDLAELPVGTYELDGKRVFAMVATEAGRPRQGAQLEAHEKYIDIQLVLAGLDEMGWRSLLDCRLPAGPYDATDDIRFFADPPAAWIATHPGAFAIFFPEDGHMPLISEGQIRKVVVKIAVAEG